MSFPIIGPLPPIYRAMRSTLPCLYSLLLNMLDHVSRLKKVDGATRRSMDSGYSWWERYKGLGGKQEGDPYVNAVYISYLNFLWRVILLRHVLLACKYTTVLMFYNMNKIIIIILLWSGWETHEVGATRRPISWQLKEDFGRGKLGGDDRLGASCMVSEIRTRHASATHEG